MTARGGQQAVVTARCCGVSDAKVQLQRGRIEPAVLRRQVERHHLIAVGSEGVRALGHHLDQPPLPSIGGDGGQREGELLDQRVVLTRSNCEIHFARCL